MECNLTLRAPNGNKSALYKKLVEVTQDPATALDLYYYTKTQQFKEAYKPNEGDLDVNGEPRYESFSDKAYMTDIDLASVDLDNKSDMYKTLLTEIPLAISKLDSNIENLKFSKNPDKEKIISNLEAIKPLLSEGDLTSGIPKLFYTARKHLVALNRAAINSTDIHALKNMNNAAKSYKMVENIMDGIANDVDATELFGKQFVESAASIRASLANIESLYLIEARKYMIKEMHKSNSDWSREDIRKALSSADRDTKYTEYLLEAMIDSQDKLPAELAVMVMNQNHEQRRAQVEFDGRLTEAVEGLIKESDSNNAESIFSDLLYEKKDGTTHILDITLKDTGGTNPGADAQFKKVQNIIRTKPRLAEFLQLYSDTIAELDATLPNSAKLGTRIPTVLKSTLERAQGKKVRDGIKQVGDEIGKSLIRSNLDTEYGLITDGGGKPIKTVPTYFTQKYDSIDYKKAYEAKESELLKTGMSKEEAMEKAAEYAEVEAAKETSKLITKDLAYSLQKFHAMSINYAKKNEILDVLEAGRDIIESDSRTYNKLNKGGKKMMKVDQFGNSTPLTEVGSNSTTAKAFNAFMDMHVYGETQDDLGSFGVFGVGEVDTNKLLRQINKKTSLIQMTFNVLGSSMNAVVGEYNNILEVAASEFVSLKTYKKASKMYFKNTGSILKDIGKRTQSSLVNQIADHYDFLGGYNEANVRVTEGSWVKRMFKSDTLFFMQGAGEHMVQNRMGLAMLAEVETFDSKGNKVGDLLDAHKQGEYSVKIDDVYVKNSEGVLKKFDKAEKNKINNKIQGVLRKIQGNYNHKTAVAGKKDARFAMVLKFRDWAYEGLVRRFGSEQQFATLGEKNRVGFWKDGVNVVGELSTSIRTMQLQLLKEDWQKLTPDQRANVRRMVVEISSIAALASASALLAYAGKDVEWDDDSFEGRLKHGSFNFLNYSTNRLFTEISAFVNPVEAIRLARNPMAATNLLESSADLLMQMVNPFEIKEHGRHKGDYEIAVKASKFIPGYKSLEKLTPEGIKDATAFYNF